VLVRVDLAEVGYENYIIQGTNGDSLNPTAGRNAFRPLPSGTEPQKNWAPVMRPCNRKLTLGGSIARALETRINIPATAAVITFIVASFSFLSIIPRPISGDVTKLSKIGKRLVKSCKAKRDRVGENATYQK